VRSPVLFSISKPPGCKWASYVILQPLSSPRLPRVPPSPRTNAEDPPPLPPLLRFHRRAPYLWKSLTCIFCDTMEIAARITPR
jgi:hypothetical protein